MGVTGVNIRSLDKEKIVVPVVWPEKWETCRCGCGEGGWLVGRFSKSRLWNRGDLEKRTESVARVPCFPKFPQGSRKGVWIRGGLCELQAEECVEQGVGGGS